MLIHHAIQHNLSYQWQVLTFRSRYSDRAFHDDLTPMPPTILFFLELKSLEARKQVQKVERLQGDGVAA
jgi:hypothetical protein